jgi:hypothetical protein
MPSRASRLATIRDTEGCDKANSPGLAWRLVNDRHVEITRPSERGFDRGAIFEFIPHTFVCACCDGGPQPTEIVAISHSGHSKIPGSAKEALSAMAVAADATRALPLGRVHRSGSATPRYNWVAI